MFFPFLAATIVGAGAVKLGAMSVTISFLTLALVRPDTETSPTQALAREVARCRSGATVVAFERPLDLNVYRDDYQAELRRISEGV